MYVCVCEREKERERERERESIYIMYTGVKYDDEEGKGSRGVNNNFPCK